jgi:cell wall-associated NlpC family hydrolase
MKPFDTGYYPNDWMLHRDEERYLDGVLEHAHPVDIPDLGDVALYRFGRTYSHSAILVDGPLSVHSYMGLGVVLTDPLQPPLVGRAVQHFSFFK